MRRLLGVLGALVLLGGVVFAVVRGQVGDPPELTVVKGVIGSEKREFFADPEVVAELGAQGLRVDAVTTGSWLMAGTKLDGYDFAFPASLSPAEEIRSQLGIKSEPVRPFYSPLVVVAHAGIAGVLKDNGLAEKSSSGVWTLRMEQYLAAVRADRTWQSLKGADAHAELAGSLYLTTTDPETSSSGALHLAAVSYLLNDRRVVADDAGVARVKDALRQLTALQGDQKTSSDGPFKDFLSGVGNPLVLVYESQVAALAAQGRSTGDLVVLYPDTTVSSDHTMVGLTDGGRRLAELLRDSPRLRSLEVRYGFRPQGDPAAFGAGLTEKPGPRFAPDLSAAGLQQAPVPAVAVLTRLIDAAKGR
ncbi:hypothetical protein [Kitasatospora sp. NPDC050543]|uniref:hypothetical protein n=1 Tax=Kitasatospora sp. NPDC050543 TaxID=3364054 RepID=UPI003789CC2B